jgi:hypothetical protein
MTGPKIIAIVQEYAKKRVLKITLITDHWDPSSSNSFPFFKEPIPKVITKTKVTTRTR